MPELGKGLLCTPREPLGTESGSFTAQLPCSTPPQDRQRAEASADPLGLRLHASTLQASVMKHRR